MVKEVDFNDFIRKLESEKVRLKDATKYRSSTAALALDIALKVGDIHSFKQQETAEKMVKLYLLKADDDKIKDVGKFLSVIYRCLLFDLNMDDDMKQELYRRKKNRELKGFTLKKLE